MSLFQQDLNRDAILAIYLDKLYKRLGICCERVADLNAQHKGIDLHLYEGGKVILVDEKAQAHYLNKSLPTFAFEIGYLKNGEHRKGWLFDEHKSTECYFLVVHIYFDGDELKSPDQITSCKILRVDREVLINELLAKGLNYQKCHDVELQARQEKKTGRIEIPGQWLFSFNLSDGYVEKPFNLVMKLDFLAGIGKWIWTC